MCYVKYSTFPVVKLFDFPSAWGWLNLRTGALHCLSLLLTTWHCFKWHCFKLCRILENSIKQNCDKFCHRPRMAIAIHSTCRAWYFFFPGILRPAKQKSPITEHHYVNPLNYEILQWIVFWTNNIQQRCNICGAVWTDFVISVLLVSHPSLFLTTNSYEMSFMTQGCYFGLFTFMKTKRSAWTVKDN